MAGVPCARHVMLLRAVPLPGAETPGTEPYLVEMLSRHSVRAKDGLRRELDWSLFGIGKSRLELRANETLVSESGSLWPPPAVPERFRDGASLSLNPSGTIRWQFPGDPPRSGTVRSSNRVRGSEQDPARVPDC
jgi:hypothetical protein